MKGFLIGQEGPLAGLTMELTDGNEWIVGRDADCRFQVLEDPMVSRQHVKITSSDKSFTIENLSTVNPALLNGQPLEEASLLADGDTVQIGGSIFRFSEEEPQKTSEEPVAEEEAKEEAPPPEDLFGAFRFTGGEETRWMIKVISGPNNGAEFNLAPGASVVIGKDPNQCDIVLQDLSVSRQHAKVSVDEAGTQVTIEDLKSRNGTLVSGRSIEESTPLESQDLIALGTTTFLIIDREQTRETIFSPPAQLPIEEEEEEEAPAPRNWKQMIIPKHHLILAGIFAVFVLVGVGSLMSLFRVEPLAIETRDATHDIRKVLKDFPEVEFSYNESTATVFLVGHVLSEVDSQEMLYSLKTLSFLQGIEDNVVIDELIWENTNALLIKNPHWRSVSMTGKKPGVFLLRGYVDTSVEDGELKEYLNLNFPYLDKLDNQVVVERVLEIEIQSIFIQNGFNTVTMQLTGGDLVIAGRVPGKEEKDFEDALDEIKRLHGIRSVKNLVIYTTEVTTRVNLTNKYQVTGTSSVDNVPTFVVIGGKILSTGDMLDGMTITAIEPKEILLEKDGIKYEINYNDT